MSATSVEARLQLTASEVLSAAEAPATASENDRTLRYGGFNTSATLNATSTPAVDSPPAATSITLGGSPTTLNLTAIALARAAATNYDFTGKKVVGCTLKANAANAANINVAPGGSNPYPLFGTGNDVDVGPGMSLSFVFAGANTNRPAVSGSAKNIDISGTSGDKIDVFFVFGG